MLTRIEGDTGRTIWAKKFNATMTLVLPSTITQPTIDTNDNIYLVLKYEISLNYNSILLIYDKDGNTKNVLLFAKTNLNGSFNCYSQKLSLRKG